MQNSLANLNRQFVVPPREVVADENIAQFVHEQFGVEFSQWCGASGQLLSDSETGFSQDIRGELTKAVAGSGKSVFIQEESGVLSLAIPFRNEEGDCIVAVRDFLTETPELKSFAEMADSLSTTPESFEHWASAENVWASEPLMRLAETSRKLQYSLREAGKFRVEAEQVSLSLTKTYEEISLLYAITQNLRISSTDEELGGLALSWLYECLPAEAVAVLYLPMDIDGRETYDARTQVDLSIEGDLEFTIDELLALVEHCELNAQSGPFVATTGMTSEPDWPFPKIRQLLIAPKVEGTNLFGWIIAINNTEGDEFGSVEASLLNTVCTIFGTHCGNRELYRRQSEFLAAVVRSLTSAIDAKDPYTCGHSDRVARIAVRLGRELGCTEAEINTLYMGGLLHDIGKIGIDDNVLRKPGHLTEEEYDHIKLHPELGFNILEDIRELADVLPIVLHHHENWDGKGYPHGLKGRDIPWLARITAVSDSFDAMTSDRTYRKGMDVAKVESIFRDGAGTQWDADVIRAYFVCSDDIKEICRHERADLCLDVQRWNESVFQ